MLMAIVDAVLAAAAARAETVNVGCNRQSDAGNKGYLFSFVLVDNEEFRFLKNPHCTEVDATVTTGDVTIQCKYLDDSGNSAMKADITITLDRSTGIGSWQRTNTEFNYQGDGWRSSTNDTYDLVCKKMEGSPF
jgi:hypothetical protein